MKYIYDKIYDIKNYFIIKMYNNRYQSRSSAVTGETVIADLLFKIVTYFPIFYFPWIVCDLIFCTSK